MPDISKHESKFVRKSYTGEISWIGFAVSWNTVSVNNLLKGTGEIVLFVKSGWFIPFFAEIVIIDDYVGTKPIVDVHNMLFNVVLEDVRHENLPFDHIVLSNFHFS